MMNDNSKRAQVLNKIEERNLNKAVAIWDAEQKQLKKQLVEIKEARKIVMENVKHLTIGKTEQRKGQAKELELLDRRFAQSKMKQKYPVHPRNCNEEDCISCPNGKLESTHLQVENKIPFDMSSNGDGINKKAQAEDNNNEIEIERTLDLRERKWGTSKMRSSLSSSRVLLLRSSLPDISLSSHKHCACLPNLGRRATVPNSSDKRADTHKSLSRENCILLKFDGTAEDISEHRRRIYNPDAQKPHIVQHSRCPTFTLPSIPTISDHSCGDTSPRPCDVFTPAGSRLRERSKTIADLRPNLTLFASTQKFNDDNVKESRFLGAFRQLGLHTSLGATILNRRRHSVCSDWLGLKGKQHQQVRYIDIPTAEHSYQPRLQQARITDNPTIENPDQSRLQRERMKRQQEITDLNHKAWSLRRKSST